MDYVAGFDNDFIKTSYGKVHLMHHGGTSEKLLFLHGAGASTRTWRKLMPYIRDDYDVYLIDLLGHGESEDPELHYNVDLQVSVVREVAEMEGINKPFLIGHSYGAWIAVFLALKIPIKGIVLMDPAGVREHFEEVKSTEGEERYKTDMLKLLVKLGNKEHVMRSILDSDFKSEYLGVEVLSRLRVPALVVWGSEDAIVPFKFARVVANQIGGSSLAIIEGAGHDPHYTDPEKVASYLNEFVSSRA